MVLAESQRRSEEEKLGTDDSPTSESCPQEAEASESFQGTREVKSESYQGTREEKVETASAASSSLPLGSLKSPLLDFSERKQLQPNVSGGNHVGTERDGQYEI